MTIGAAQQFFLGASKATGGGAAGYQIERSLRFNSSDSGYLSRTPSVAGNRKTWTWAGWVKRSALSNGYVSSHLFGVGATSGSPAQLAIYFSGDSLFLETYYGSGTNYFYLKTSRVFRDLSAWYHIVVVWDTTQATAADRIKFYVNGVQESTFSTSAYPTSNFDGALNDAVAHNIGRWTNGFYFDGYLADIHFIDGQALTPSSFTEVSATTGQLIPKAYTGSFGTNGFWLKFSDNSAATATTLGKDYSGNSNNWTPNNLSVTAGAGNDSLVDTPTSYGTDTGAGGEVRGNYATLNPLSKASVTTLSNGNLDASMTGSSYPHLGADSTIQIPVSGKWYWEITPTTVGELWLGVRNVVDGKQSTYYRDSTGGFNNIKIEASSSTGSSSVASYTNNDVISVALNADSLTIAWYKNGSQVGSNYSLTTVQNLVPYVGHASVNGSAVCVANFGQRPFAYTAPSGFKALCDTNLPAPVVAKPNTVMDVKLYTGNGSTQTISGLGFSPDFVWIKRRDAAANHDVTDTVRGATKSLYTSLTQAEATDAGALTAFNSDGFSLGATGTVNTNNGTYAAWTWDAGSSTVSNTQGSITSSVRANASAGFSIVTYTVSSSSQTAGHGLGVASPFIIQKRRDGTGDWYVGTTLVDGSYDILLLNTTAAKSDAVGVSAPTSTVFSTAWFGTGSENWVAYCFAPVTGYSSFGSYTGNGSADGPFVYTGFRPRWVMIKRTDASVQWVMYDSARDSYNVSKTPLAPNESTAESGFLSGYEIDILSNGFKIRNGPTAVTNASGSPFVYAAFAESPLQYSRAR